MRKTLVLVLHDPDSPEANLRCDALGSFIHRLSTMKSESSTLVSGSTGTAEALVRLAGAATVVGRDDEVHYVPTRAARERVAGDQDGAWPQALASRHRKRVRTSAGTIFHFPMESDAADGSSAPTGLTAFVTDWTGLPSSCAVAVHPGHPASTGLGPDEDAAFTGRFCRHPLTGDLLPIWVADWVKPEFGTGAVLINPGHNAPDLEFSRKVGLPVRFSLAPKGYDGAPSQYINPPFIKSGHAFRTGNATEGLPFDEAKAVYFATVAERGLVEEYTDSGMGTFRVASMAPSGVEVSWDARRRTVSPTGHTAHDGASAETVTVEPSPVLHALAEHVRSAELTVVAPSTRVEDELLALRLLLAEPGVEPAVKNAPDVVVVSNAQRAKGADGDVPDDVLRLALLVSAGPLDNLSVKPQHLDPAQRFLTVHETLRDRETVPGQEPSAEVVKVAAQVKGLLMRQELKQAFTQLYRLQKTLAKSESLGEQDLRHYCALAHVVAGVATPYGQEALVTAWEKI
ncbi:hypothetical protein ABZ565_09760 [Streptomyces sp. NPDC016469]|uniref:hypothetical protein n=1 Tax=Streptomyces sp. NPDC016469 TaxID=3157191 RepID=UPI0033FCCEFE